MKALYSTLVLVVFACSCVNGQYVNAYAQITNITNAGGSDLLDLAFVDESADTFEDGDRVIVMQMQDDVIGPNTGNNASFGLLNNIAAAGLYQIAYIESHSESGGLPVQVRIQGLDFPFSTGSNSNLQLISFPNFGSPDYALSSTISSKEWDGNTGGVLAIFVDGVLTLNGGINLDGTGFRGADRDRGGTAGCNTTMYRRSDNAQFAAKGEGIFRRTAPNHAAGKARILTGGGGGNPHNAGGGGGGNFTTGGDAGPGWSCTGSAGGLGGIALSGDIAVDRVFMGGGGGSGEGNNNLATGGGDGGGIILLKAREVRTVGTCTGRSISADGESVASSSNDGGGGGGAAGSIVLEVDAWNVSATCPVDIQATGGDGGDVTSSTRHGGGGGGGLGNIFFSVASQPANVTPITSPGLGGNNSSNVASHGTAADGGGIPGDGIFYSSSGPLPIDLAEFDAVVNGDVVEVSWVTETEINNWYFSVERSVDGSTWDEIITREGAGDSQVRLVYEAIDDDPVEGFSIYRLKQTDFGGEVSYSQLVPIEFKLTSMESKLYPNPAKQIFTLRTNQPSDDASVYVYNAVGQLVPHVVEYRSGQIVRIRLSGYENGLHTVLLQGEDYKLTHRVLMVN